MPVQLITGTVYGFAAGEAVTYSTARNTSTKSSTSAPIDFGQWKYLITYGVDRAFVRFDTSSIVGTIEQVRLGWKGDNSDVRADFTGIVKKYDWSAYTLPGNRETMFDGALAATSETNNMGLMGRCSSSTTIYYSGNLDTTWINRAGNTYYALVSLLDVDNHAPTDNEYFVITAAYLEITTPESNPPEPPSSNGYSSGPMMFKPLTDLPRVLKKPVYRQIASPRRVCQGIRPRSVY